jgi:hypothetical protein
MPCSGLFGCSFRGFRHWAWEVQLHSAVRYGRDPGCRRARLGRGRGQGSARPGCRDVSEPTLARARWQGTGNSTEPLTGSVTEYGDPTVALRCSGALRVAHQRPPHHCRPVSNQRCNHLTESEGCVTHVGTFKGVVAPILHLLGCSRHSISNKWPCKVSCLMRE